MHGGRAGRKPAHGRYSSVWAYRLAAKIRDAEIDPQIFNQHKRAAFLQALLSDAIEQLLASGDTSPAELWQEALDAFHELREGIRAQDVQAVQRAMEALETTLTNGDGRRRTEERARSLIAELAELSRVQYQGLKLAAEVVTVQELQLFIARLIAEIQQINLDALPDGNRIKHRIASAVTRAAGITGC